MTDPRLFHFKLPAHTGSPTPVPTHAPYPNVDDFVPSVSSDRRFRGDGQIRAVVIHATAGTSSAGAMDVLFQAKASWHWLIPDEDEGQHGSSIWRCIPEDRAAWHVRNDRFHPDVQGGARLVNYWSIGIEIVNSQTSDPFSDWQVRQAAALVRSAWSRYPDLTDVVSHAKMDPTRRSDPGADFPWERFKELVLVPPAPLVAETRPAAATSPIQVVGPDGQPIETDAVLMDGVTMVEARPLLEALGYRIEYDPDHEMVMHIRE